jgi:hypothetical protein
MKTKLTETNLKSAILTPRHVRSGQMKMRQLAILLAITSLVTGYVNAQNVVVQ